MQAKYPDRGATKRSCVVKTHSSPHRRVEPWCYNGHPLVGWGELWKLFRRGKLLIALV